MAIPRYLSNAAHGNNCFQLFLTHGVVPLAAIDGYFSYIDLPTLIYEILAGPSAVGIRPI